MSTPRNGEQSPRDNRPDDEILAELDFTLEPGEPLEHLADTIVGVTNIFEALSVSPDEESIGIFSVPFGPYKDSVLDIAICRRSDGTYRGVIAIQTDTATESTLQRLDRDPERACWMIAGHTTASYSDEQVLTILDSLCPNDYDNFRLREAVRRPTRDPITALYEIVIHDLKRYAEASEVRYRYNYFDIDVNGETGVVAKSNQIELETTDDDFVTGVTERTITVQKITSVEIKGEIVPMTLKASANAKGQTTLRQGRGLTVAELPRTDTPNLFLKAGILPMDIEDPDESCASLMTAIATLKGSKLGPTL